jgi:hypothetical protein
MLMVQNQDRAEPAQVVSGWETACTRRMLHGQQGSTHNLKVGNTTEVLGSTAVHGVRWGQPAAVRHIVDLALPTGHATSSMNTLPQ